MQYQPLTTAPFRAGEQLWLLPYIAALVWCVQVVAPVSRDRPLLSSVNTALSKQWALPHCWKSRETAAEASSQCGHRSAYINSHTTMISMCRNAFLSGLVACEMVRPIDVQHLISHLTFHCCQPHTLPLLSSSLTRHLFQLTSSLAMCSLSQQQTSYMHSAAAATCFTRRHVVFVFASACPLACVR